MKLLLDENLPHRLRRLLVGHDVYTVTFMRWNGIENGELLRLAADSGFDALITADAGMPHAQNRASLPCSIVLLQAASNAMDDLQPLVPQLLAALQNLPPRTVVRVT
jgi:predicted nuclease of predicted toxin-antitoxin system